MDLNIKMMSELFFLISFLSQHLCFCGFFLVYKFFFRICAVPHWFHTLPVRRSVFASVFALACLYAGFCSPLAGQNVGVEKRSRSYFPFSPWVGCMGWLITMPLDTLTFGTHGTRLCSCCEDRSICIQRRVALFYSFFFTNGDLRGICWEARGCLRKDLCGHKDDWKMECCN